MEFDHKIIEEIKAIISTARKQVVQAIDHQRVVMYWHVGHRIFEEEQRGKDRAEYGEQLIKFLSSTLQPEFGTGFSSRNLNLFRQFYRTFPIVHALRAQLSWTHYRKLLGLDSDDQLSDELNTIFNRWAKVRITDPMVLKLVQQAMAPSKEVLQNVLNGKEDEHSGYFKNLCQGVCEYAFSNETQQMATTKGTLFGVYNAVTGYFQNVKNYKDEETKAKSILYGNGLAKSQNTFRLCADFEKLGADLFSDIGNAPMVLYS